MPARSAVRRRIISTIAATERHTPDSPDLPGLRAELATESIADWITRQLATAPPLTPAQLGRLRSLLRPGAGNAAT